MAMAHWDDWLLSQARISCFKAVHPNKDATHKKNFFYDWFYDCASCARLFGMFQLSPSI